MQQPHIDFLGFDLDNQEFLDKLQTTYTHDDYVENLVKVKLKTLATFKDNISHMIEGIVSESTSEFTYPYHTLMSNKMWFGMAIDFDQHKNILWKAVEELGDIVFFTEGLKIFTGYSFIKTALVTNDIDYIITEINTFLSKNGLDEFQRNLSIWGPFSDIAMLNHVAGNMVTILKKHTVSGDKYTEDIVKPVLNDLIYCLELIINMLIVNLDEATTQIANQAKDNLDNSLESYINIDVIYLFNDYKLNKRYRDGFTDDENLSRNTAEEKLKV